MPSASATASTVEPPPVVVEPAPDPVWRIVLDVSLAVGTLVAAVAAVVGARVAKRATADGLAHADRIASEDRAHAAGVAAADRAAAAALAEADREERRRTDAAERAYDREHAALQRRLDVVTQLGTHAVTAYLLGSHNSAANDTAVERGRLGALLALFHESEWPVVRQVVWRRSGLAAEDLRQRYGVTSAHPQTQIAVEVAHYVGTAEQALREHTPPPPVHRG